MTSTKQQPQLLLRFAICDDSDEQLTYIKELTLRWAAATNTHIDIKVFSSAEAFLFEHDAESPFDILLLDIEMPGMDGVTLARRIRQHDENIQIIFVTGYEKYIADGYDVAAFHFLIKPVKEEKFFEVLSKASMLIQRNEKVLFLNTNRSVVKVLLHDIVYIEASQNYIDVHTKDANTYHIKTSLVAFEASLDEAFFRTGKSFIVGLRFIKSISKTAITLDDGTVIPLGRGLYDAANKAFINFF